MKCEICGARKAVIHIQQVIGKERVDLHLCEECALERGISGEGEHVELSISNMLNGLLDIRDLKERKNTVCPQCGSTWESIQKREKLGCAECYTTFSREIHFLLEKMGADSYRVTMALLTQWLRARKDLKEEVSRSRRYRMAAPPPVEGRTKEPIRWTTVVSWMLSFLIIAFIAWIWNTREAPSTPLPSMSSIQR